MADVQIVLANSQSTSGGQGPGPVTVPQDEAQGYVDAGYAVFTAEGD